MEKRFVKEDKNILEGSLQKIMEIKSPNGEVLLKQFAPQNSEEIFALIDRNREHLSQFGDDTAGKYPDVESVRESIINPKNPDRLRMVIYNKQKELVGSINLTPQEKNPHTGEIGYYLGSKFTGKGYATEAVKTLTDFAFNNLDYKVVFGKVTEGNTASANVLLHSGYVETGRHDNKIEFTCMRENKLTIQIKKSISEVFEFTTSPKNTPLWIDSIIHEETNEWPVKVGTTYRNQNREGKWSEYLVAEFKENEMFEMVSGDKNYHVRYNFRPLDNNMMEMEYDEWMEKGKLEEPFTKEILNKLKTVLEKS
jgi:ribosomal-protein-serine acetyltransferase